MGGKHTSLKVPRIKDDCRECFRHVYDFEWQEFKHAKEGQEIEDEEVLRGFDCFENRFKSFKSAAHPPDCPKSCQTCSAQFRSLHHQAHVHVLRYEKIISDSEAALQVSASRDKIEANFATITKLLNQYGDIFMKRWIKKNISKRTALLFAAMPKVYKRNLDGKSCSALSCTNLDQYRTRFLLPWLNIQCLSEDAHGLLAMIHSRVSNSPASWIMFDNHQLHGSFVQGALSAYINSHCVVMCCDADKEFGALVPWNLEKSHRWDIIGFPKAQLILESQALLSNFLRTVVETVLEHGLKNATEGDGKWLTEAAQDFRGDAGSSSHCRPPAALPPPSLCLPQMLETFAARYASAKDEAELLQTDPAFARELLASAQQSKIYKIGCKVIRAKILTSLMTDSVARVRMLNQICERATATTEKFERQINQGKAPSECAKTLRTLDAVLVAVFQEFLRKCKMLSLYLGLFDDHFNFGICGCDVPVTTPRSSKDPVYLAINGLASHNDEDSELPGVLLYQLQTASDLLPLKLQECICDLAAVDKAVMALRYFRPSYGPPNATNILEIAQDASECEYWKSAAYLQHVDENQIKHSLRLFAPLEELIKRAPTEAKLTAKSLSDFDASHEVLSKFWAECRQVRKTLLEEKQCPEELLSDAMKWAEYNLASEFTEAREMERLQLKAAIAEKENRKMATPRKDSAPVLFPASTPLQTVWGAQYAPEPVKPRARPKGKAKTRPSLPALFPDGNENHAEEVMGPLNDLTKIEDRIEVSSGTMEIITRTYVSYGKHRESSVRWNVFVAAMEDAGLVADKYRGGSEVMFRDTKRGKGSIVFHAPHPDPKINPICMRAYGKRLQRNMGWNYDLFVERE